MPDLYPMFFKPVLKSMIWGGRSLEDLGRPLPDGEKVAESWEIAAHQDGMTIVENGIYAGMTLQAVLGLLGDDLVGTNNEWALARGKFPLLVKLLDANRRLSVQVHPDDVYAREHEGNELGKTEMWVVLKARPEAAIILGLAEKTTPVTLRLAIDAGGLELYMNKLPIKAGDHVCVPAGMLHAILEGAVIAEIQQNSNTTYRVFDWNRVGADGNPRSLHIDKALDVIDFNQVGLTLPVPHRIEENEHWVREQLCQNKYFTTERFLMNAGAKFTGNCNGSTLEIWGVVTGKAVISGETVEAIRFGLIPAGMGEFSIDVSVDATLLRIYTP